jgi:hypothetical protein
MRLFRITVLALAASLSACSVSGPTVRAGPDCGYGDNSFNRPRGMQLPKDACAPQ